MERTWIVVCDAARARLFATNEGGTAWTLFEELSHPASRAKGMDLVSDRDGRSHSRVGSRRTAMDAHTDPREVEHRRFAAEIAQVLERARAQNAYEKLVLVAPPDFLGALRGELTDQVAKAVYATLDKDYTRMDERELPTHVITP